ncbi:UPF0164 family protein, partial [candidate division FCPU426 bacterium]|nr:UPF0164 family protein [candidate division FCPU426 bacterium]
MLVVFLLLFLAAGGVVLLAAHDLPAAEIEENYSYSKVAMPELLIGVGTRPTAMGGAAVALSDDPSALYWNPAGLQQSKYPSVEFVHNAWFQEMNQEIFTFVMPFSKELVLGVGGNYFGLGAVEKTGITA